MTSMKALLGKELDYLHVKIEVRKNFGDMFDLNLKDSKPDIRATT